MSRVINPDSVGKQRTQLSKGIVLALRQLARQTDTGGETRDLAAFIAVALQAISEGIDASVAAWEKRGYWVKADKFRMEWAWAGSTGAKMRTALLAEDWPSIAMLSAQVGQKLNKVQVGDNHRLGSPWAGAYERMRSQ
ncbi:MAG TPA: hypothetical protein VMJ64_17695 [Anaerolineales bacterium]|nr:hypothetical protein [Anaerolineales bacterium]